MNNAKRDDVRVRQQRIAEEIHLCVQWATSHPAPLVAVTVKEEHMTSKTLLTVRTENVPTRVLSVATSERSACATRYLFYELKTQLCPLEDQSNWLFDHLRAAKQNEKLQRMLVGSMGGNPPTVADPYGELIIVRRPMPNPFDAMANKKLCLALCRKRTRGKIVWHCSLLLSSFTKCPRLITDGLRGASITRIPVRACGKRELETLAFFSHQWAFSST